MPNLARFRQPLLARARFVPRNLGSRSRFAGRVSGIKELNFAIRVVTPEGLCAWRQKERIVTPDREQRRLLRSEILLELRVQGDIACVVQEKVELNLVIPGPSPQGRIEGVGFRRH